MSSNVGVIGLGIMGGSFARNLLANGFNVSGFDILKKNVQTLVALGGNACVSPKDVASLSDVVICSLPSSTTFHDVMTGEHGIREASKDGLVVVECSTLTLEDKQLAHDALAKSNMILLDCPISGTGAQAVERDLSVYVSGNKAIAETLSPVFEAFARSHFYVGDFGNGSRMKFLANHLVHIHNVATAEVMVLGMKAGLDPATILNVISDGAGNSRILELRGPMMVADSYDDPTMKMSVWQKDMKIIDEFAKSLACPTPMFDAGKDIYAAALSKGMDELDTASVCRVMEEMAELKRPNFNDQT
ncbi:MAG TPA: NAD(P)-dependent oxidoreductase [Gammaproteobacteria bacterium]|nr:NAD(P)-dependent oxidoreductase [Gammaproteobacteria bacterium]